SDAARNHIKTDDMVEVTSATGTITVRAEVTDQMREGVVSYPHGWGHDGSWSLANAKEGANVNRLVTSDASAIEQISGASWLDGFAVSLSRTGAPRFDGTSASKRTYRSAIE
ncbi:MAG: molybdopterin dinucleotide binding domain-containing protein, partial [Steroidobacteraceae bacterium]